MSGNPLLSLLETDALSANDIARSLGKPVSDIGAELSMLTLMGQLVERGGKYFYIMLIKISSIANVGLETVPVDVEVDVATAGFPGLRLSGLQVKLWKRRVSG